MFAATAVGMLLAAAAAIALLDPLAISPLRVVSDEILPQTNRRYLVPVIVRGHRYDSYIVGTSSVHSLDPKRFDALMPGRFANLSLFASTPFEQAQVIRLIARVPSGVRTIIWGLDVNWCNLPPLPRHSGLSEFPDWLYDDDRWNDLLHAFNWQLLDLARRKLQQVLRPKARACALTATSTAAARRTLRCRGAADYGSPSADARTPFRWRSRHPRGRKRGCSGRRDAASDVASLPTVRRGFSC